MVRAQWRTAAIAALVLPAIVLVASEDPAAAAVCTITGTEGDDHLTGTDGADVICGLGGDDVIVARGGADELVGGEGNDRLNPGTGDDVVDGGAGKDWVSYRHLAGTGVEVNLVTGMTAGAGGADSLAGIENVVGSPGDDTLTAPVGQNFLRGLAGDDVIAPGEGYDDLIDGGPGVDWLDYSTATGWVSAGLRADHGWWRNKNLENIIGSPYGGLLSGDLGDNVLIGGPGRDTITGYGGDDVLDGGAGNDHYYPYDGGDQVTGGTGQDVLHYDRLTTDVGVRVNMDTGRATTIDDRVDQHFSGIETAIGTQKNDIMRGGLGAVNVTLDGEGGFNTLNTEDGYGGDTMKTYWLHAAGSTCTGDPGDITHNAECLPQGG